MASGRFRGEVNQGRRYFTDPLDNCYMARTLKELAEIHFEATDQQHSLMPEATDVSMAIPEIILPYADEDTRVSFVNHYGDVFADLLRFEPKVMTYNRAQNEGDAPAKIQSAIRNIVEELHQVTDDKYCCMELDFIKIVFTDPKPPLSFPKSKLKSVDVAKMIEERSPELRQYEHRSCLNKNEDVLLDKLRDHGVEVIEHTEKSDNCRVEIFSRGFKFKNRIYGGTICLTPGDLKFHSWGAFRQSTFAHTYLLSNPGSREDSNLQTEWGDLRLKGLAFIETEVDDIQEMARTVKKPLPSYLTTPNLGGLLHQESDSIFRVKPNTGISHICLMTNRVEYKMSLNGIEFTLKVMDMKRFRLDRKTQSLMIECVANRWPKLKIPIPSKNEADISNFVETFSHLIINLINDLSNGEILPKIWSTNVITSGVPIPIIMMQNLRRRIMENHNLRSMLDLPPDAPMDSVMERYQNLLDEIKERRIILSDSAMTKLRIVARLEDYQF